MPYAHAPRSCLPATARRCAALAFLALCARAGSTQDGLSGLGRPGLPPALARAADVTDQGEAFVELVATRDSYLAGEPFELALRFGFERDVLERELVQLFQRPLDVPAQVHAAALETADGLLFLDGGDPAAGASFALGERITRAARMADAERGGRTFAVFEFRRSVVGIRPGELVLDAPVVRFARATRFEDDFVQGRVPLDRREELVRGNETRLAILPLPEEGRPPEFTGAIGRFTIAASAEPRELAAGESLALTVRIEAQGFGDLSQAAAPRLGELAGFHARGELVERDGERLTARYDLVPLGPEVEAVPPVRFTYFDTTPPAGYRTLETAPIALVVHAPRAPTSAAPPLEDPVVGVSAFSGFLTWLAAFAIGLACVLALALLLRRRRG